MVPINKVLLVSSTPETDFFDNWVEYLAPKHHLNKSEQRFLAACLRQRYELSKSIADIDLLNETSMNAAHRAQVGHELGMKPCQIQAITYKLKKLGIFIPRNVKYSSKLQYYLISPSFIPDYEEGKDFSLLLVFR